MNRRQHLDLLRQYVAAVNRALLLRAKPSAEQLSALSSQGADLLHYAERAHMRQAKGPRANVVAAAARRASQPFALTWRGTGSTERLTGWSALAARTGLQPSSLRVLLSKGRGTFTREMLNERGEPDAAEIKRL